MYDHNARRAEHYRVAANRSFSRGFAVGFLACAILVAAFVYGQREAYGAARPAPRDAHTAAVPAGYPPHWRTWIEIGRCEQPSRDGSGWHGIAWKQTYNHSFPGGLGFTRLNWTQFRPHSARHIALMSDATPVQQLWAAERIYQHFARTHSTGYAATVWDCHENIGWYGFNEDGSWR